MSEPPVGALLARLRRDLGPRWAPLATVVEQAERHGVRVCLVGGPVRDLLLGRAVLDVDVLLSDQLEQVARESAARLRARVQIRPRFLTATLESDGFRIDLSRAREERYPRPGALPLVSPADLEADLPRRDFSIHAIALPLSPGSGRRLIDPLGGVADLGKRRLRVLHEASFRDDPTRLWRAARYAARLGFRLEPETARLARLALREGLLDSVSGTRVLHEIERLLDEASGARAARRSDDLGLLAALAPGWALGPLARRALARLDRARTRPPWPEARGEGLRAAGLRLLLLDASVRTRARACARLGLRGRPAEALQADLARVARLASALARSPSDGRLDALLSDLGESALLTTYCALAPISARRLARHARVLRHVPDPLDGHAARQMGAEGPRIGALLRAARQRALDGAPVDPAWAQRWLARRRGIR